MTHPISDLWLSAADIRATFSIRAALKHQITRFQGIARLQIQKWLIELSTNNYLKVLCNLYFNIKISKLTTTTCFDDTTLGSFFEFNHVGFVFVEVVGTIFWTMNLASSLPSRLITKTNHGAVIAGAIVEIISGYYIWSRRDQTRFITRKWRKTIFERF